jgi:hypothetical protein
VWAQPDCGGTVCCGTPSSAQQQQL